MDANALKKILLNKKSFINDLSDQIINYKNHPVKIASDVFGFDPMEDTPGITSRDRYMALEYAYCRTNGRDLSGYVYEYLNRLLIATRELKKQEDAKAAGCNPFTFLQPRFTNLLHELVKNRDSFDLNKVAFFWHETGDSAWWGRCHRNELGQTKAQGRDMLARWALEAIGKGRL